MPTPGVKCTVPVRCVCALALCWVHRSSSGVPPVWFRCLVSAAYPIWSEFHANLVERNPCGQGHQISSSTSFSLARTDVISGEAHEEADLANSYHWASQSGIHSVLHVDPVHCLAVPVAPRSTGSGVLVLPAGALEELEEQLGHGTVRFSDTVEWTAPSDVLCEVCLHGVTCRTVERSDECTGTARECWGGSTQTDACHSDRTCCRK